MAAPSVEAALAELSVPALGAEDVEVTDSVCFSVPPIERAFVRTWLATAFVIEAKSNRDLESEDVQAKREAAQRWANHVSADEKVEAEWRYLLVSEDDVKSAKGDWKALKSLGAL